MGHERDSIGEPAEDDWMMDPSVHAAAYAGTAPQLAALLKADEIRTMAAGFTSLDGDANDARDAYKTAVRRAIWTAIAAAVCASAASIYGGVVKGTDFLPLKFDLALTRALVAAQVGLLTASALMIRHIDKTGAFAAWRETRARAEDARMTLFRRLMKDAAATLKADPALGLQVLAYTRRYLWRSQLAYFSTASARALARAAGRRVVKSRFVIWARVSLVLAVFIGVGALVSLLVPDGQASPLNLFKDNLFGVESILGGAGVLVAALLAAGQADEALDQDDTYARRYRDTALKLAHIGVHAERLKVDASASDHLDALVAAGADWAAPSQAYLDAEAALGAGDAAPANAWLEDIAAVIGAEHSQWLTDKADAAKFRAGLGAALKD